ncbi:MAG: PAS domain S-box protein [Bacteroidales bacterium]|nr:PAS domain S-box protein [Bacteroidales bacterium]
METKKELYSEIDRLKAKIKKLESQPNNYVFAKNELSELDVNNIDYTNALESIIIFDKNGKYIFLNNSSAKFLGGKPKDFIKKTIHQTLSKNIADKFLSSITEVFNTEKKQSKEISYKTEDYPSYFIVNTRPIINSNNKIKYVVSTIIDLTKEKEFDLQKSIISFKTILDNVNAGIYVADINTFKIVYANKFIKNIFGNVEGKICWKVLQKYPIGVCDLCNSDKI